MKLPLYIINAFTRHSFGGNPAAVCPLETWLPDAVMQNIAAQHNLSETAFFVSTTNGFHIRWFTPTVEVALCGHATLASAFVLFEELGYTNDIIVFDSKSGPLQVTRRDTQLTLNFPLQPLTATQITPDIISAIGAHPTEAFAHEDLVLVFNDQSDVLNLKPDFVRIKQLPFRGVIATAPGTTTDFVCRFFAPAAGIDEDPVTGSAYTKLAPYWSQRLNKSATSARQVSLRGGDIECEVHSERVLISGSAILYAKGEISLAHRQ